MKFFHTGLSFMTSLGIQSSPIFGNVLYARPASLPATYAPDNAVVATSAAFINANFRNPEAAFSTNEGVSGNKNLTL